MEILPCPFCGNTPKFPETVLGTWYDVECCYIANISLQICDYMTYEERIEEGAWDDVNICYNQKYIDRVRNEAIKLWNTRK